jgi:glycosyltransferase involved in cell wall biosynthesis
MAPLTHRNETPVSASHTSFSERVAPFLSIVIPCYNEEQVLQETNVRLGKLLRDLAAKRKIAPESVVYYVDDGSTDRSWSIIESLGREHPFVRGIKLSRNRGHQNALLAGLFFARGDIVISVDADLQDDLAAIEAMVNEHALGNDIVYGVRQSRTVDTLSKRLSAETYYKLLKWMGVEAIFNHADFRLMSRRAIDALREFKEVNLFLRGVIPQLGFKSSIVLYDRAERFAGESKYPLGKMMALAWQGITSFSAVPLHIITTLGFVISVASFVVTIWVLAVRIFNENAVPGWASTVLPIYFIGGIQLLCIGIIGEYLAKIYMETKGRPRYVIEKTVDGSGRDSLEANS